MAYSGKIPMENPCCGCKLTPKRRRAAACSCNLPMENPCCGCKLTRVQAEHIIKIGTPGLSQSSGTGDTPHHQPPSHHQPHQPPRR